MSPHKNYLSNKIVKKTDKVDEDLTSYETIYDKASLPMSTLLNDNIDMNNKLLSEYNRSFYDKYDMISNKNKKIMNKNKIIMINNREATRKANMVSLLKLLLFWAIIITVLNFLRIAKTITNTMFMVIALTSFVLVFIYFLYTTQRGNTKKAAENIAALSDATARGFAKTAAINFIPSSIMNPYTCPNGCHKDTKKPDKLKDYSGGGDNNDKRYTQYNTKYDVSYDPSKTGLPYMYDKKIHNRYPDSKLKFVNKSKQYVKGINTGKALCYTCLAISENDSMNAAKIIKTNIPCNNILGYVNKPGSEPTEPIKISDCK